MRLSVILLVLASAGSASAEPLKLSVDDVVHLALSTGPDIASARSRALAAEDQKLSMRGQLLPTIAISEEYQHWDSPFSLVTPGAPAGSAIVVREGDTNAFGVAASQPLLGLLRRNEQLKAESQNAEAAAAAVRVSEAALREAVEIGYLQMFEASAGAEIARTSQGELAQQVTETSALLKAGTATNADVLRVKVALANAHQQEILASSRVTVARANLLAAIGHPPDDPNVEFSEPTTLLAAAEAPRTEAGRGVDARPELEQLRRQAEAKKHEQSARKYSLLPEVNLEAAYTRVDGQVFMPKNSGFVGIKAEWAIWQWGTTYYGARAASRLSAAAESDLEGERRRLSAAATARAAELGAAASAVRVAQESIASAEEAYRVTNALVRAGAGTTTDLLDSQSALTQARWQLSRARYERAIAHVQLERALGGR